MTCPKSHALLCLALVVGGCHRLPEADRVAALETVRRNVRALEEKNLEAMMATIHPRSPAFAATRTSVEELMKDYDLKCDLMRSEVVAAKKGEVRVRFEQTTQRIKGGVAEASTRLAGVHVLRKDGEAWKIYDTEVISAEATEPSEEPEPAAKEPALP